MSRPPETARPVARENEVEVRLDGLAVFRQAAWATRFPGLVQGLTGREPRLRFGRRDEGWGSDDGWERLMSAAGISRLARCQQVHGARVVGLSGRDIAGWECGEADALVTAADDVLLAVTVADCVPVFVVDPERRLLGLAHAGWRGTAAGVVEATLAALQELGARPESLHMHLGPAICGRCYEVGPEVPVALGEAPSEAGTVDLRDVIVRRVLAAGVTPEQVTVSGHCTLCTRERFYSYRGGDRGRRMCAFLGWALPS